MHRTVTIVWAAGIQCQWTPGRRLGLRQVAPALLWQQAELAIIQVCHSSVVYLACDRSANTGHVAIPLCQDLWRALVIGLSVSSVEPVSLRWSEFLIHSCTVYVVQPSRTGRSGGPSSEWPLP